MAGQPETLKQIQQLQTYSKVVADLAGSKCLALAESLLGSSCHLKNVQVIPLGM